MVIKVIARGFIVNRHTYLREAWNWLDFIVIVLGYSTFLLQHFGVEVGNIAGIRTFRVLRALKTVSIVPGLKTIVNALLHSLRMLGEVMALTIFCMMIFALFALQVYIGVLRQKCVADAPDYVANSSDFNYTDWTQNEENWYYADHSPIVCGNTSMSRPCPTNYTCLPHIGENPNFGFTSFDDFGWAMLTSFQLITLDFWEDVYNKIIEAMGPANIFFFIFVIFFGSFFLVNLMLAVVAMSYEEAAEEVERQHDKGTKLVLKTKSTVFEFPDAKQMRIKIRKLKKTSFGVKRKDVLHRKRSPDDDDGSFTTSQRGGSDGTGIGGYYTPSSQTPETTPRTDNLAASPSELPPAGSPDNDGEGANGIRMVITPPPNDDEASASYSLSPSASDYAESTAGRSSYSPDSPDRHNSNNNMGTDVDDDDDTYAGLFQRLKHRGKLQRNRRVADDDMDDVDINCVELHPRAVGHAELSPPCSTNSVGSDDRLLDDFDVQYRYSPPTSPRRGSTVSGDDVGLDDYIDTNRWPNRGSNGISSVAADADRYPRIADRPAIETTMLGGATRPEYAPRAYLSSRQRRSFPTPDEMLNTCGLPERGNSLINLSPWKTLIEAKIQSIRGEDAPFKFLRPLSEKLGIGGDPEAAGAAGRPPEARPEPVSPLTNAVPSRVPTFPRNRRVTFGPAESLSFRNPTPEPGNRAARGPLAEAGDGRSYLWPVDDNNKNNNMGEETGALKINGPREEPEGQESNTNNKFISQEDELYTQNNAAVNKDGDDDDGGGDASPKTNSDPNARNCACFRRLCCCYTPWLRFQQWLFTIVTDPLFDLFITLCIVLNTAFLAVEHHGMTDRTRHTLEIGNYVPMLQGLRWLVMGQPLLLLMMMCQCFKAFADSSWARHWFSLRVFMYRIVDHKIFEGLVLFVIFASSLTLVFEDVYLDEKPVMKEALFYLNITFLVLFVVEMLMKWIAYGFHVYFTNFWCILDCFIVVVSLMSTIMETHDSGNSDLMAFRSLRTLRALRPLRAISRWEGMKFRKPV
ncbi:PREDICTED: sodium channel protein 60E-like [Priapulus caudatus]|uniref:Sodium channel protein 60E-like n=1 Tax=Priapulus caudatus TaxID=37621 RepID=A0ABM1DRX9_PRICU|nr:PREDICTED: sodium channel protein 60E-like [Priapulus caudatus]